MKKLIAAAAFFVQFGVAHGDTQYISLPAQPLAQAIQSIAQQTNLNILVDPNLVRGKKSPPLTNVALDEALATLLAGTGLTTKTIDEKTITVIPAKPVALNTDEISLKLVRAESRRQRQREVSGAQTGVSEPSPESRDSAEEDSNKGIPEMLVKGKRSANTGIQRTEDDVQPYVVYDRAQIQRSMADNLEDFLKIVLPMNTSQTTNSQAADSQFGNTSSINLRGLGANQTLILVNGRRMAGVSGIFSSTGSFNQPDLNGIPLDAVERIEVLPSTASGIYGGGATGGVVNIILRQDFSGVEARATYENAFDTDAAQRKFSLNAGWSLEGGRTNITLNAGYSDANPLSVGERDFAARGRELMRRNDPTTFYGSSNPPIGYTTNIRNIVNAPLRLDIGTLLTSNFTYVPVDYAGVSTDGGRALVSNAGSYNLVAPDDSNGAQRNLISGPTVESAILNLRREFSKRVEVFADLSMLHNRGLSYSGILARSFTLPAGAVNNPFTTDVRVTFPSPGIAFESRSESKTGRGIAGVIVRLPGQWTGQLEYSLSRSEIFTRQGNANFNLAGNTALTSGGLDVMRDLNRYPLQYPANYFPTDANYFYGPAINHMDDVTVRAAGPLLNLPGGPLTLSGLLEDRKEAADGVHTEFDGIFFYYYSRSQEVRSGYVEFNAPFISARNGRPGLRKLQMQVSARLDRYKTNGVLAGNVSLATRQSPIPEAMRATSQMTATDYTFGVSYAPTEDLQLRASVGTGFLPPSVVQVVQTYIENFHISLQDPARSGAVEALTIPRYYSGGNADLRPEKSRSLSAGLIFTPRAVQGLRLSIDYTHIRKVDEIANFNIFQLLLYETLFPERVVRGPKPAGEPATWAGPIVELDASLINVAKAVVRASDVQLDYSWETANRGRLSISALATHQTTLGRQVLPDAPYYNSVGYSGGPLSWRGNAGLTWEKGNWTAGWNSRFFNAYRIYAVNATQVNITRDILRQGSDTIPSQVYHDIFARYRFDAAAAAMFDGAEVMVGVRNIFDRSPPILPVIEPTGGYSTYGDPRMRFYTLTLRKSFR